MILRAAFVLDRAFRVQSDWAVRVSRDRIAEIGPASKLHGETCTDLGDVLLMPGLVNAHTHLELGFLAGKVAPGKSLVDWLGRLLPHLREVPPTAPEIAASIEAGLSAALRSGTSTIGDITRTPQATRAVIANVVRRPAVVSFGEVIAIGALRGRLAPLLDAAAEPAPAAEHLAIGLSPHAPYTVEPEALTACAARARAADIPLCIHAAESEDEILLTREGRGPLRDFLEAAGVWDDSVPIPGCTPIELLERCGVLGPRTLLAHCNYLSETDIEIIASSRATVVYCPRTHAAFGHAEHPVAALSARRVPVCIGTDSLASNPSLSMLEELRFLQRVRPELTPLQLLQMATIKGMCALEPDPARGRPIGGRLEGGYRADLIALTVPHGTTWRTAAEEALSGGRLAFVMKGGRVVRSLDGSG